MGEVPEVRLSLLLHTIIRDTRNGRGTGKRADDRRIERLNEEADEGTRYKVLWVARHGQGVHNVVCPPPLLHLSLLWPYPLLALEIVHKAQKLIFRLKRNMELQLGIVNGHY